VSFWYPCGVPLVLASRSPRRHAILLNAGIPHVVEVPEVEEDNSAGPPGQVVEAHARLKAHSVAVRRPDSPVLGADTLVCVEGEVLGKPSGEADAAEMLGRLSGRRHEVWGGVCLEWRARGIDFSFAERTVVDFRALSGDEISAYVLSGEPMDKAGAYGIQEIGALLVRRIEGCYFNVMGLPVARFAEEFRRALERAPGVPR